MLTGSSGGVVVKLLACGGLIPGLSAMISEIGWNIAKAT